MPLFWISRSRHGWRALLPRLPGLASFTNLVCFRVSLPPRIRFLSLFALIFGAHLIWEISNDLPPPWDMAYHEVKGREYLQAWEEGRFLEGFSRITTHFPPLY